MFKFPYCHTYSGWQRQSFLVKLQINSFSRWKKCVFQVLVEREKRKRVPQSYQVYFLPNNSQYEKIHYISSVCPLPTSFLKKNTVMLSGPNNDQPRLPSLPGQHRICTCTAHCNFIIFTQHNFYPSNLAFIHIWGNLIMLSGINKSIVCSAQHILKSI